MMTEPYVEGKTTMSPEVLVTIASMAALGVEGVSRFVPARGARKNVFKGSQDGIRIEVEADLVFVDLFLVLNEAVNIREVSRAVQRQVTRAITEMTGMLVGHVNIHVEDID
jgi:uncharacterized alkaline shock family protein YloU